MQYTRVGLYAGTLALAALFGCEASVGPTHRNESPPPADETVYRDNTDPARAPAPDVGTYRQEARPEGTSPDYRSSDDRSTYYDRDRVTDDDRRRADDRIPSDGRAVGERLVLGEPSDKGLFYEPRNDGRIFVRNEDTGRVIYSGPLRSGQQFWLNLTRERATVDGHTVFQAPLRTGDRYQLYFQER